MEWACSVVYPLPWVGGRVRQMDAPMPLSPGKHEPDLHTGLDEAARRG
jgi:hypothetical protein